MSAPADPWTTGSEQGDAMVRGALLRRAVASALTVEELSTRIRALTRQEAQEALLACALAEWGLNVDALAEDVPT